ncbi:MAG: threonyl-tRNA synthetase editing domain-containing protein [Proteobacteria bacterium]|nr:threonyl-tRNA synthetase editing domain-containing protein [Pseudomonadota bacterium]MBU4036062.1 threonyl-tRNA synthetase editing domain-containing protein [Pseudomonadota bacterium]
MRLLFWYFERFAWNPSMKTLDHAPEAVPMSLEQTVVAFIHVEPPDVVDGSSAETKLVKNAKWLARMGRFKTGSRQYV